MVSVLNLFLIAYAISFHSLSPLIAISDGVNLVSVPDISCSADSSTSQVFSFLVLSSYVLNLSFVSLTLPISFVRGPVKKKTLAVPVNTVPDEDKSSLFTTRVKKSLSILPESKHKVHAYYFRHNSDISEQVTARKSDAESPKEAVEGHKAAISIKTPAPRKTLASQRKTLKKLFENK